MRTAAAPTALAEWPLALRSKAKSNIYKLKIMENKGKISNESIDMIFKTTYGNFDGFNAYQTKRNYKKTYTNLFGGRL